MAINVLRIHSETVCFLRFAAIAIAFKSSPLKRTGTIRPLACPLGRFGLPTRLGFCFKASKLLYDCGSYGFSGRRDRVNMQDGHMPPRCVRVIHIMRPGVDLRRFRVSVKFKYFDYPFPNCSAFFSLLSTFAISPPFTVISVLQKLGVVKRYLCATLIMSIKS